MSAKVSYEKTTMYKWGAPFCEEALTLDGIHRMKDPIFGKENNQKYNDVHDTHKNQLATLLKVDFPKMRLLSVETKQGIGSSDEEVNPALGKFKQLSDSLDWPVDTISRDDCDRLMLLFAC
jgi:hypothetical protein